MAQDEFKRYFFAEEAGLAARVGDLAGEFAGHRPGDPRARIVAPDGRESLELSPILAEAVELIGYLMSRGHAVAIEAVSGQMTIQEVADLVQEESTTVEGAIRDGIIPVADADEGHISITHALIYRNHIRAKRRLGLDEIADLGRDDDDEGRPRASTS